MPNTVQLRPGRSIRLTVVTVLSLLLLIAGVQTWQSFSSLGKLKQKIDILNGDVFPALGLSNSPQTSWTDVKEAEEQLKHLLTVAAARAHTERELTDAIYARGRVMAFSAFVLTIISLIGFGVWLFAAVLRPMSHLTSAIRSHASGGKCEPIPYLSCQDEIGALAEALKELSSALHKQRAYSEELGSLNELEMKRRNRVEEVRALFQTTIQVVGANYDAADAEFRSNAELISHLVEENARQTDEAARAANAACMNVDAVAAAAEQLHGSISEINRSASDASNVAVRADDLMVDLHQKVSGLATAANTIENIVKVISSVAQQTNLLALNATIEAARAGEYGRGFSVVALEVKNLAAETSNATEIIQQQVEAVQDASIQVACSVDALRLNFNDIRTYTETISDAVSAQTKSTMEIGSRAKNASTDSRAISSNIHKLSEATLNTEAIGTRIATSAAKLSEIRKSAFGELREFMKAVQG